MRRSPTSNLATDLGLPAFDVRGGDMVDLHGTYLPISRCIEIVKTEEGGAVILDFRQDRYLGLDQTALFLWESLAAGNTPAQVVSLLKERYADVPGERLQGDVAGFIKLLEDQCLLTTTQSARTPQKQDCRLGVLKYLWNWRRAVLALLHLLSFTFQSWERVEAWWTLFWVLEYSRGYDKVWVEASVTGINDSIYLTPRKQWKIMQTVSGERENLEHIEDEVFPL